MGLRGVCMSHIWVVEFQEDSEPWEYFQNRFTRSQARKACKLFRKTWGQRFKFRVRKYVREDALNKHKACKCGVK